MESHSSTNVKLRIELITADTQDSTGQTLFVSLDTYYWNRSLGCFVPFVIYKSDRLLRNIDQWRNTMKHYHVSTLFIKRRI